MGTVGRPPRSPRDVFGTKMWIWKLVESIAPGNFKEAIRTINKAINKKNPDFGVSIRWKEYADGKRVVSPSTLNMTEQCFPGSRRGFDSGPGGVLAILECQNIEAARRILEAEVGLVMNANSIVNPCSKRPWMGKHEWLTFLAVRLSERLSQQPACFPILLSTALVSWRFTANAGPMRSYGAKCVEYLMNANPLLQIEDFEFIPEIAEILGVGRDQQDDRQPFTREKIRMLNKLHYWRVGSDFLFSQVMMNATSK